MRIFPSDGMLTIVEEKSFCLNVQTIWCQKSYDDKILTQLHNFYVRLNTTNIMEHHQPILTYFNLQMQEVVRGKCRVVFIKLSENQTLKKTNPMDKCWHSVTSPIRINCADISNAVCGTGGHELREIISHFSGLHQVSDNTQYFMRIFPLTDMKT